MCSPPPPTQCTSQAPPHNAQIFITGPALQLKKLRLHDMSGFHATSILCPSSTVPSTVKKNQVPLCKVRWGSESTWNPWGEESLLFREFPACSKKTDSLMPPSGNGRLLPLWSSTLLFHPTLPSAWCDEISGTSEVLVTRDKTWPSLAIQASSPGLG